ncbi:hypothetical protein [Mycolicibacterium sediminis]|nr:hypothetical protein [Mycolicibacterium sediminis]
MTDKEGTIDRAAAVAEDGAIVRMYRHDGLVLTYDELYAEVDAEGSALPAEQWRDGVWNAHEYIVEACLVGIYDQVEVLATLIEGESGAVVEYSDDLDEVIARRRVEKQ